MKALVAPLVALAVAAAPATAPAQHAGHDHHAMPAKPAPKKPAPKRPAVRPAAKAPAKKPAPGARPATPAGARSAATKPAARPAAPRRAAPSAKPASTASTGAAPAVNHAAMGHGTAPTGASHTGAGHDAMDHGAMDHAAMGHAPEPASDHAGMDHDGMDHASMGHGPLAGSSTPVDHAAMGHRPVDLPADAAPRTPIPALTEADRAAAFPSGLHGHTTHDRGIHSYWLADRLEWQDSDEGTLGWEGLAWIGTDLHRVWLRSEGEASEGEVEHGDLEVLYGRSVTPWWDIVAGVRQDFGHGPSRTWAAVGVQGLAPYKFEVEATAYVGTGGRTAATLEAEYDTLITNRLILQWQAEASLHGRDDPARGIGSGLSTVEAGARLRYEITRRFAPYVGVQVERAFGRTADLRRHDGEPTRDTRLVAGIRFWF